MNLKEVAISLTWRILPTVFYASVVKKFDISWEMQKYVLLCMLVPVLALLLMSLFEKK